MLHEGTGNIDFIYGPYNAGQFPFCEQNFSTGTCAFAGGMEDGSAGTAALTCAANCASTLFPAEGVEVSFSQHPDVQITQVQTPGSGVQGGNMLVTLQLFNIGGLPANGGTGSVYYSTDGQTFDASNPLTTFGPFNLNGSTAATIMRQVVIPATAPLGTGWIIATVSDPGDADPTGKQVASPAFDVFGAEADLDAAGLTAPSAGKAGSAIALGVSIQNVGSAGATKIPYSYYLSSSPTVSPSDLVIGGGTIPSLAAGATYTNTDQAQLPAALPAGSYTVGVIVDPAMTIPEYTHSNSTAVAKPPMQVSSGALAVTTTTVPAASVGAPYQTVLVASGGGGVYTWTVDTGKLPAGIELAPSGTVSGTPSTAGDNPVTVKVTDQNAQSATAPLDFKVAAQALPLAVLTNSLPGGSFGVNYSVALVAIGGAPPYQWSILSGGGTPPPGIGISLDGTLAGAPEADGAFVFQVQVTDSANAMAQSQALDLQVLSPGSVGVAEAQLPPATEGVNYDSELLAAGGTPPYTWALVDDQRLPSGPGDQAQDLSTAMPGGLSLDSERQPLGTGHRRRNLRLDRERHRLLEPARDRERHRAVAGPAGHGAPDSQPHRAGRDGGQALHRHARHQRHQRQRDLLGGRRPRRRLRRRPPVAAARAGSGPGRRPRGHARGFGGRQHQQDLRLPGQGRRRHGPHHRGSDCLDGGPARVERRRWLRLLSCW